jgi:dihydrofolate reductase
MSKLTMFNLVSLDGFFAGESGDISWHQVDAEFQAFTEKNVKAWTMLLFGRVTYELMAGFWPRPEAVKNDPVVAGVMNKLPKIVFSRTLERVEWNNTRLVKDDLVGEVRSLKKQAGQNLALLGSGQVVSQLAPQGLIDEYQVLLNPLVLGKGRSLFAGINAKLAFKLTSTRTFGNGNVLLCYVPIK